MVKVIPELVQLRCQHVRRYSSKLATAALMLRLPILNALLIYVYILSLSIKNQPLTGCERLICFIRYTVFSSTNRNSCSSLIRVIDSSFRRSPEAFTHVSAANLINYPELFMRVNYE